jgi:hypothetical protein
MKPRIHTQAAIEWARTVLQRHQAEIWAGTATQEELDADLQEYNIAFGVAVDGIYQNDDRARPWWLGGRAK